MVITRYQFFSAILEEDLNIPNRWYLTSQNRPDQNHKYYKFYENHFKSNIKKNDIKVIYTIGSRMIKQMDNICFTEREINAITLIHELKKC